MKFKKFTYLYIFILVLNMFALAYKPSFFSVTKILIMSSLLGFYSFEISNQSKLIIVGMIAALLGDAFLLIENQEFFIIGMLSFLIMQICYTLRFKMDRRSDYLTVPYIPVLLVLLGLITVWTMKSNLDQLFWPISFYTLAIVLMASFAYWRRNTIPGYTSVYMGSIVFVISDFLLAINKFHIDIPYERFLVILTYMIAQYLIITGIATQEKALESRKSPS